VLNYKLVILSSILAQFLRIVSYGIVIDIRSQLLICYTARVYTSAVFVATDNLLLFFHG